MVEVLSLRHDPRWPPSQPSKTPSAWSNSQGPKEGGRRGGKVTRAAWRKKLKPIKEDGNGWMMAWWLIGFRQTDTQMHFFGLIGIPFNKYSLQRIYRLSENLILPDRKCIRLWLLPYLNFMVFTSYMLVLSKTRRYYHPTSPRFRVPCAFCL